MSRSIGDNMSKKLGVIATPEITELEFSFEDKFIVIASDGIWDFLTNSRVFSVSFFIINIFFFYRLLISFLLFIGKIM